MAILNTSLLQQLESSDEPTRVRAVENVCKLLNWSATDIQNAKWMAKHAPIIVEYIRRLANADTGEKRFSILLHTAVTDALKEFQKRASVAEIDEFSEEVEQLAATHVDMEEPKKEMLTRNKKNVSAEDPSAKVANEFEFKENLLVIQDKDFEIELVREVDISEHVTAEGNRPYRIVVEVTFIDRKESTILGHTGHGVHRVVFDDFGKVDGETDIGVLDEFEKELKRHGLKVIRQRNLVDWSTLLSPKTFMLRVLGK